MTTRFAILLLSVIALVVDVTLIAAAMLVVQMQITRYRRRRLLAKSSTISGRISPCT